MRVWNCPVLPVMPWVMTLVSLLMRIDIFLDLEIGSRPVAAEAAAGMTLRGNGALPGGGDDLLGRLAHVRGGDDRQPRVGEDLLAEIDVRPLEADHQRHLERDLLRGGD